MLGSEMRPSSTISFEPALEQGVPWGRDLITFMTSAAGYMMRTLQKPRKNKPSKRQVNHRRFLHNMIQRKFADIEAANHQLASSLFSVDTESQGQAEVKSTRKHESETNLQKVFGEAETNHLYEDNDTKTIDSLVNNPPESGLVSNSLNNLNGEKVNQISEDGKQVEHSGENSLQEITNFTEEREQILCASVDLSDFSLENIERTRANSHIQTPNSPDGEQQYLGATLSALKPTSLVSLHSCEFDVQTQPDKHILPIQHTAENIQMDLMENFELLDPEEYLYQIDQMDMATVWDIHSEEEMSCFQDSLPLLNTSQTDLAMDKQAIYDGDMYGALQQITTLLKDSVKNTNVEDELRSDATYSRIHCGSRSHHDQARQTRATMECCLIQPEVSTPANKEDQYSSTDTWPVSEQGSILSCVLQEHKNAMLDQIDPKNWGQHLSHYNYATSKGKNSYCTRTAEQTKIIESELTPNPNLDHSNTENLLSCSTAHCYGFDIPLQANSNSTEYSCSFSNNGGIPSFEGVAQSFPAPYHNPHPHQVSTPPLNDDWLFSNISVEVDFNSMGRSHGHTYC